MCFLGKEGRRMCRGISDLSEWDGSMLGCWKSTGKDSEREWK